MNATLLNFPSLANILSLHWRFPPELPTFSHSPSFLVEKESFVKFTPRKCENARVHVFNPESVCLLAWIPTNLFACSFSAKYHRYGKPNVFFLLALLMSDRPSFCGNSDLYRETFPFKRFADFFLFDENVRRPLRRFPYSTLSIENDFWFPFFLWRSTFLDRKCFANISHQTVDYTVLIQADFSIYQIWAYMTHHHIHSYWSI